MMSKAPGLLSDAEQIELQFEQLALVFQRANRVLAERDVDVVLGNYSTRSAPAWSDGQTITLNYAKLPMDTSMESIVQVTGLNFHELCHIMFTPRPKRTGALAKLVQKGLHVAFNLLEDQRIESMFTGLYPAVGAYFTSTFLRFCLTDITVKDQMFIFAHGRRYMPADIREAFEVCYRFPEDIEDIKEIIDEYRDLVLPRDLARAIELTEKFAPYFYKLQGRKDPFGHGSRQVEVTTQGKEDGNGIQQEAQEWADYREEEGFDGADEDDAVKAIREAQESSDDDEHDDEGAGFDDDVDDDVTDGDSDDATGDDDADSEQGTEGDDEDDAADSGTGDMDSDDEDGEGHHGRGDVDGGVLDQADDNPGGDSAASTDDGGGGDGVPDSDDVGQGPSRELTDSELASMLDEAIESVESKPAVQDDVRSKQRSMQQKPKVFNAILPKLSGPPRPVVSVMQGAVRQTTRQLRRIADDKDPGWNMRQSSGKLNINRMLRGDDPESAFDRWDQGVQDVNDIECVVLLDISGSMDGQMDLASQAVWVLKNAIEKIGASVTVLAFETDSHTLYNRGEKAQPTHYTLFPARQWTYPFDALKATRRLMGLSPRRRKLLVTVTDGQWDGTQVDRCDKMVELLNANDVTTGLLFIDTIDYEMYKQANVPIPPPPTKEVYGHFHKVFSVCKSATDIVPFARDLVAQIMKDGR